MPKFLVKEDFRGAIRGCYVKQFTAGTVVELDDPDLASVAVGAGWMEPYGEDGPDTTDSTDRTDEKAAPKATRNKAVKSAPKLKGDATE